jgi:hypothetical protein
MALFPFVPLFKLIPVIPRRSCCAASATSSGRFCGSSKTINPRETTSVNNHFVPERAACKRLAVHEEERNARGVTVGFPRFTDRSFCVLLAVWCLMMASSAFASAPNVYIAQTAAGSANGSSCASAYAVSFFNSSANWGSASTQIGPGTTINLCGTFTASAGASGYLTFQGSGTSGNPITLLFQPGAVLQAPYFGPISGAIEVNGQSYIVINGGTNGTIQNTANGTPGSYANQQQTSGIDLTNASNVEVRNLTIANLYVHTSATDNGPYDPTNGACIYTNGFGNGISIHDNTFHDGPWCIDLQYGPGTNVTSVQIYNNNIYNVPHGIVLGGSTSGSIGTAYIYGNHIHDFGNWGSTEDAFHLTGTHLYGGGVSTLGSVYYYNNQTDGIWGNAACPDTPGSCITAHLFIEAGTSSPRISNLYVFNNVGIGDVGINNGILGVFDSSMVTEVYNNTLISADSSTGVCYYSNNSISHLDFRDNVMSGCSQLINIDATVTFTAASPNYNIYAAAGSNAFVCDGNYFNFAQFSNWQSCLGSAADANSSAVSNAGLNNSTGVPNSGSPVIGPGTNLYSVCNGQPNPGLGALCFDKDGTARPTSAAWDVGAYQFGTAANMYTLSVVNGTGSGNYAVGAAASIAANAPPAGQTFLNWSGAAVQNATAAATTLTMSASSATVTANYTASTLYALTVASGTGSGTYAPGTVVTISADLPPSGSTFLKWSGATVASSTSATTTLTMPAASTTVTANYVAAASYALTVANGTGSGTYAPGTVVTVTANAPPSGSSFLNWSGATVASSTSATTTLTMPAASATVTANYTAAARYALTVTSGTGSGTYAPGTVVTITANAPPSGSAFLNWSGTTVASSTSATTTLTMPAASATVTANYTGGVPLYAFTVVNGTGSGTYAPGTVVTITANAPPSGSSFLKWSGATVATSTSATTILTMPAANAAVTANYTAATTLYALTVTNGTGSGTYAPGTVVTITANAPPAGSTFLKWSGATVASSTSATTTLTMPAASATVTANYTAAALYALTVANGTGSGTYAPGAVVVITANAPPEGEVFVNWTSAPVSNPAASTTTLTMPAANTTAVANFHRYRRF